MTKAVNAGLPKRLFDAVLPANSLPHLKGT